MRIVCLDDKLKSPLGLLGCAFLSLLMLLLLTYSTFISYYVCMFKIPPYIYSKILYSLVQTGQHWPSTWTGFEHGGAHWSTVAVTTPSYNEWKMDVDLISKDKNIDWNCNFFLRTIGNRHIHVRANISYNISYIPCWHLVNKRFVSAFWRVSNQIYGYNLPSLVTGKKGYDIWRRKNGWVKPICNSVPLT